MPETSLGMPRYDDWRNRSIAEITELVSRGTAPAYVERSDIRAIGQRCVTADGFDESKARPHDDRRMGRVLAPRSGDVLLNSTGNGTIGRSCVFRSDGDFIVDGHVTVLRPRRGVVDGRWLEALIRSTWGQRFLETYCYTGSTNQIELARTPLTQVSVPLPPLDEQLGIAEVLDSVDKVIRSTECLIAKLDLLKLGAIHSLLSPARCDRWTMVSLGAVSSVSGGVTLGRTIAGSTAVELPYLRVANVQDGHVDTSEIKKVRVLRSEVERYALAKGDVLLTEGGDFDKLGRGAVWDGSIEPCLHQNHIFRVRCDRSVLSPDFLAIYCASSDGRRYFLKSSKQTTNLASINITQLKAFPVPVPSISEQTSIVETVADLNSRIQIAWHELDKLRQAKHGLMDDLLTGWVRVNVEGAV